MSYSILFLLTRDNFCDTLQSGEGQEKDQNDRWRANQGAFPVLRRCPKHNEVLCCYFSAWLLHPSAHHLWFLECQTHPQFLSCFYSVLAATQIHLTPKTTPKNLNTIVCAPSSAPVENHFCSPQNSAGSLHRTTSNLERRMPS